MVPGHIDRRVVTDRLARADRMVAEIRALPLQDKADFLADSRNIWAAESCLRRALEALFDLGRHILAKGFGRGVEEYKQIAEELANVGVLSEEEARLLRLMAGYRNRLVHFYHDVSPEELFQICAEDLDDVERIADAFRSWVREHVE